MLFSAKKTVTEEFVRNFSDELKVFKTTPQYEFILGKYLK